MKINELKLITIYIVILNIIFLCCSCGTVHPFPEYNEIYVYRDPNTYEETVNIIATHWTDGSYYGTPTIKFKSIDGNTWIVSCYSDSPDKWKVDRIKPGKESEEIKFDIIFKHNFSPELRYSEFGRYTNK